MAGPSLARWVKPSPNSVVAQAIELAYVVSNNEVEYEAVSYRVESG